jgi:preprotein translocase subunit SecE
LVEQRSPKPQVAGSSPASPAIFFSEAGGEATRAARSRRTERGHAMNDKIRWYKRFVNFLRDVKSEIKKVTWPSRNEVTSTTIVVIAATIFFGFYLFFMDVIFSWVISRIKSLFG